MGSSPRNSLTPLQNDLLEAFFARERRFFLTGGAALAGFYFGHRATEDLDLFTPQRLELQEAALTLGSAAEDCGANISSVQMYPEFRRFLATRGDEKCIVDLVVDRAPAIDTSKRQFGAIRVDTLREIAANKICTILGRSQIKDLVDLQTIMAGGIDLETVLDDARRKDGGVDPASLAWILDQLTISPDARLPGGVDPRALDAFRQDLVTIFQKLAFRSAR